MTITAILTADEMRAAERRLFATGIPEYDVMERAGAAVADYVWRVGGNRDTLVLCGPGNNGGDGFVIARILREHGVPVRVAATGDSKTPSAQAARSNWNGPVEDIFDAAPAAQLVDALFGTGLTRGLDAPLASQLCSLVTEARYSFAVDMPSGVHTDSGECLSDVPQYDLCVTLGAAKPAHLLYPAAGRFRHLRIADIGIDTSSATAAILARPALSPPEAVSHKYSRGLVAIVSGAMPGAARLAAVAAARGGAGYVRLIGDQHPPLDAIVPASLESLDDQRVRAMLIGPGLGRDAAAKLLLARKLARSIPAVIDADALLLLDPDWRADMPVILTPHSGEFAILHPERQGSKIDQARAAAAKRNAVVIFKGADTVIAAPDGRVAITGRSSSWLSTAGTGDVLAGLCAARLAVSGDAFDAACEAVWLHGEAARRAGPAFAADDLTARIADAMGACL